MTIQNEHTVRSYDEELVHLINLIARMGGLAEAGFEGALKAVAKRDSELASRIIAGDAEIDTLESDIHAFTVRLLALRQPVAQDLRLIVGALKVSGDLERIGDYAANVAKRAIILNELPPVKPTAGIPRLGRLVQSMVRDVLDAYVGRDNDSAVRVWHQDQEVDDMYTSLFRELITYMMEDPRNITPCTHLMFIAKNIERIGDHATNIAETVHFLIEGQGIRENRPKGESILPKSFDPGSE